MAALGADQVQELGDHVLVRMLVNNRVLAKRQGLTPKLAERLAVLIPLLEAEVQRRGLTVHDGVPHPSDRRSRVYGQGIAIWPDSDRERSSPALAPAEALDRLEERLLELMQAGR